MTDHIRKLLSLTLDQEIRRVEEDLVCTEPVGGTDKLTELERGRLALCRAKWQKYREDLLAAKREIAGTDKET